MKKISNLYNQIRDEIQNAAEYITHASLCKQEDKQLADTYCKLAQEDMNHVSSLHKQVVRIIQQYRKTNGEPPPVMQARYDVLHEIEIKDANKVKMMIQVYKQD